MRGRGARYCRKKKGDGFRVYSLSLYANTRRCFANTCCCCCCCCRKCGERSRGQPCVQLGREVGMMNGGNCICVPSTRPHISDLEISPAVEWDGGVQEESGLVFPEVVLQVESCNQNHFSTRSSFPTRKEERNPISIGM